MALCTFSSIYDGNFVGKALWLFLWWNTYFCQPVNRCFPFRQTIHHECSWIFCNRPSNFLPHKNNKRAPFQMFDCLVASCRSNSSFFFVFSRWHALSSNFYLLQCCSVRLRLFLFTSGFILQAGVLLQTFERNAASRQGKDVSHSERRQHVHNLKLVKYCFIVVVCYCICFLPLTL